MIERAAVERAFQLCLQRPVDSEAAFEHFTRLDSLDAVYDALFGSAEFRGRLPPEPRVAAVEAQAVETAASAEALARMVAHVEATWAALGETEPHWSVVTEARFKAQRFAANAAAYRDYGRADDALLGEAAARAGVDLTRLQCCFELGCGTGRVTEFLARRFPRVIAADVSRPHLAAAMAALGQPPEITWLHLTGLDGLGTVPEYDMVFCRIVLQHNPPPVIAALLTRVLRRLAPQGVAFVQVPVWIPGYRFSVEAYLAGLEAGPMEMHALPQRALLDIVQECGCRVRDLREDLLGALFGGISNTLLLEKFVG